MKKGLLILSDNVEDVEAFATRALLKRAGYDITTASTETTLTINSSYNLEVKADIFLKDASQEQFDFLIIPGGPYVAEKVDQDTVIKALSKSFNKAGKLIAAICAGPRFLGQAKLLENKHFTAYSGSEKDIPKGHYHPEEKTLRDGNIITARGAGVVYDFVHEIITYYETEEAADELLASVLH